MQISDRLLSQRAGRGFRPFDKEANKTIIYFARDAYVSIGYTGLAYLEDKPTDQWLAEKLSGEDFDAWGPGPSGGVPQRISVGGPEPRWFDIGLARQHLRSELIALGHRLPSSERPNLPTVVLAGWQRGKKVWRPIMHSIVDLGSGPLYEGYGWTNRWGWEQGLFYLDNAPRSYVLNRIRNELNDQLTTARGPDETEALMATALRLAADQSPGIGKDYLVSLLPPPGLMRVKTRYVAFEEQRKKVERFRDGAPPYSGPVGFSPWILAPRFIAGPAVLVNSSAISGPVGDFTVELEGPKALSGTGLLMSVQSQPRPKWSRRNASRYGVQHPEASSSQGSKSHQPFILRKSQA